MIYGWIYCFSNQSMPGIVKIGMTKRSPAQRLKEANKPNTWLPTPFKIEMAKKVYDPEQKEKALHDILSRYVKKTNSRREFFYITIEEVKVFFELMDGKEWKNNILEPEYVKNDRLYLEEEDEDENEDKNKIVNKKIKGCRNISKCLIDGQYVRHFIGDKKWKGQYNIADNEIVHDGKSYKGISPLNQFVKAHYEYERPDRTSTANAWRECECKCKDKWISMYNLPVIEEIIKI